MRIYGVRTESPKTDKILIVLSSQDKKTESLVGGFWFPELTHPVEVFDKAGLDYDLASPKGGLAPFDGFDLKDPASATALGEAVVKALQTRAK